MKKKLLSLALVLAMALTLLPTAALAGDPVTYAHQNNGTECTGKITWTQTATHHTGACEKADDPDNCPGITEAPHDWNDWDTSNTNSTRTCKVCSYEATCDHSTKTNNYAYNENHECLTCGKVRETPVAHDYDTSTNKCKVCGKADPSKAKSITLGNLTFNDAGTELTVNFTSANITEGTTYTATVTVKTDAQVKASPFTATGTASPIKVTVDAVAEKTTYEVVVSGDSISSTKGTVSYDPAEHQTPPATTPTTPETPKEEEKAPSTNSQGVPVASEVTTAKQANQAIDILKQTSPDTMADKLMTSDAAASSFASLEAAVKDAKGITTGVDKMSGLPSVVNSGTVAVTGAAFNASGSSVRLVVDVPSKAYTASAGYQVSMTLTGVSNAAKLAVPVIVTLPLPSDVQAGRVVVLHYHSGSTPTVIIPTVSGSTLRFAVTGFSDFVITDYSAVQENGSSGFYTVVQGGGNRIDPNAMDDATLAAIASLASGDVFTDVLANHWAADQIRWARNQNLMGGYEDGSFHPTAATTRQQLWMVLARMDGTFPATMADARAWAINTGVSDGSNPTGVLSRQQLVTMLYRFAQSKGKDVTASTALSAYADGAKVAPYAKDALAWAAAKGIVTGSNGKLNPENTATRAHFAVFLSRYSATVI